MKVRILIIITSLGILTASNVVTISTSDAATAVCVTAYCAPNPDGIIDMRRPLNNSAPITICEIVNNWKVDAVIQVVAGLLKVNWVVTLIPSVICHLVG